MSTLDGAEVSTIIERIADPSVKMSVDVRAIVDVTVKVIHVGVSVGNHSYTDGSARKTATVYVTFGPLGASVNRSAHRPVRRRLIGGGGGGGSVYQYGRGKVCFSMLHQAWAHVSAGPFSVGS